MLNGVFSAVPYILMMVIALLSGPMADYMRKAFSTAAVRKSFTTIGKP